MAPNPRYTECASWQEALDEAALWDHACEVRRTESGWIVHHFDHPNALEVTECHA